MLTKQYYFTVLLVTPNFLFWGWGGVQGRYCAWLLLDLWGPPACLATLFSSTSHTVGVNVSLFSPLLLHPLLPVSSHIFPRNLK